MDKQRFKSPQQILPSRIQQHIKRIVYHGQVEFTPRILQYTQIYTFKYTHSSIYTNRSLWYTTLTNWKLKTIWSSQYMQRKLFKIFHKITMKYPFMVKKKKKNSPECRHRRILPQHKGHIQQNHGHDYSQWWKTESISSRSGTRQGCPLSPLLFNIVLEVLATATRQ